MRRKGACGVIATRSLEVCKWPHKTITYYENMALPGLTRNEVITGYDAAFSAISKVTNLTFTRVLSPNGANISAKAGRIDGPYGTVGLSYLPCGASSTSTMNQTYDSSEAWDAEFFRLVALHEVLHAIGLDHTNIPGNIMNPVLDLNVTTFGRNDLEQIQLRYGATTPPTPSDPIPVPKKKLVLDGPMQSVEFTQPRQSFMFDLEVPKRFFGLKTKIGIATFGEGVDTVLSLGQNGKLLVQDDDSAPRKGNSRLFYNAPAGLYQVLVAVKDSSYAGKVQVGVART